MNSPAEQFLYTLDDKFRMIPRDGLEKKLSDRSRTKLLGGCTAMDVISILKKMRVETDKFNVKVEGDLTEERPKQFYKMHVVYEFTVQNLPIDKLQKAVELSEERYCGVSAVYKKVMELSSEIKIIEP